LRSDGSEWSIVFSETVGFEASLVAVDVVSADDVWAVGSYRPLETSPEQTFIMHWDGAQWSQVASPNAGADRNKLWGVSAVSADDVWAVGYHGPPGTGQPLTLHWDGKQWSVVPAPTTGSSSYLFDVKGIAYDNVWAMGNYAGSGSIYTLAMRWNGSGWVVMSSPQASTERNYLYAVDAVSPDEVWAVGDYHSQGEDLR
jgi:hypothetical protein